MKSTHIRISEELRNAVAKYSKETGRPSVHIVNQAVREYLKKVTRA